ncbi:MAG: flippase-like domain-containing protein [Candidatus Brocadiales bacterium]|nr:flippase-like domain-containing protein [Candidatus Bathyanammoxibius amoris]
MKSLWKVKIVLLTVGLAGFGFLLYRLDAGAVYADISQLGWKFSFILLPYIFVFALDTTAWRYAFHNHNPKLSFVGLFGARMAGESINCITPSGYLGGEPVKAYLLKSYDVPLMDGMASVVISRTIMTVAQALFVLIGVAVALSRLQDTGLLLSVALGTILFGLPLVFLIIASKKKGLFTTVYNLLKRLNINIRFLDEREAHMKELDENIAKFYSTNTKGFYLCFAYYFVGWFAGVIEVYLILTLIGVPIDPLDALIIESLFTVARTAASFIPGSIGGQEGGVVLIFLALHLTMQAGMTFSVIRRIREALWIGLGLLVLARWEEKAMA